MQVQLYRHVDGLRFDDPQAIILRNNYPDYTQDHDTFFNNYITPALYWQGEGKTYNIENAEICEIPLTALSTDTEDVEPVYIKIIEPTAHGTRFKYFYVNSIERLPQKARLYITLDVFATFYGRAKLKANSLIIKRSTIKINPQRLILLPDEVTPESDNISRGIPPTPQSELRRSILASTDNLVFILKLKQLSAKNISNEAYTVRVVAIPVGKPEAGTDWYSHISLLYFKICNIYEGESNFLGLGLKSEIQDIALTPLEWWLLSTESVGNLRYINPTNAKSELIAIYAVNAIQGENSIKLELNTPTTAHNKIIIGNNEISLPAYSKPDVIHIIPVCNLSDFDILFSYQNNEPESIKTYFQCEVATSTNETSLEKIARWAGYIMGLQSATQSAAVSAGTSMATGNPLGLVAGAMSIKGATDNITAGIIAKATRQVLPATHFASSAFATFFNIRALREGYIYQEYIPVTYNTPKNSQAITSLSKTGVEWYNPIEALESLIVNTLAPTYKLIIKDFNEEFEGRKYIEADAVFEGIPLNDAQELANLLSDGVEIVGA